MSDNEEYWQRLAYAWTHAEHVSVPGQPWRALFTSTRPGREHMMEPDVLELLADLPERIRVWRGAVRGLNEAGLSWAIDRRDAVAWAHRNVALHEGGTPVVVRATVSRDDVIAFFVARLEMEIVALPEHVTVDDVEDVSAETLPEPPSHREIESG